MASYSKLCEFINANWPLIFATHKAHYSSIRDTLEGLESSESPTLGYSAVPQLWVSLLCGRRPGLSVDHKNCALAPGYVYVVQASNFRFALCSISEEEVIYSGFYHSFDTRILKRSEALSIYGSYLEGDIPAIAAFHGIDPDDLDVDRTESITDVERHMIEGSAPTPLDVAEMCFFQGDEKRLKTRAKHCRYIGVQWDDTDKVKYYMRWSANLHKLLLAAASSH